MSPPSGPSSSAAADGRQQQQQHHDHHDDSDDEHGYAHMMDETRESLVHAGSSAGKRIKGFWDGFADFALQDNVLEIALGLIFASAFTQIVNSLVSDIVLPPFSLLPFLGKNLDQKFAVLRHGDSAVSTGGEGEVTTAGYNTLDQALEDGAVVLAYGQFIDKVIRFFVLGLSLYSMALMYQLLSHDTVIKRKVKCRYCRKYISIKAKRCLNCTSWQDGREDTIRT